MNTKLTPITQDSLTEASALIQSGQLVAFPTETVYGLGGSALDAQAVLNIFRAKERPVDNPLIVHIASRDQAFPLCRWTDLADTLASAFWPGPLTLLLRRTEMVPDVVTAGLSTVDLRLPAHQGALAFLRACALPVAAPSANRSGRPSPTTAQHVMEDMDGRIPLILDGGASGVGLESTVLDLSGEVPTVLRPGAVTPEQITMVAGSCEVASSVMRPLEVGERALSPGMRHRHYAPQGRLTLVEGEPEAVAEAIIGLHDAQPEARILAMHDHIPLYDNRPVNDLGQDAADAAHRLFYLLRSFDAQGVPRIFSETLPPTGLGLAVMNRLARAAEFDIIKV